MTHYIATVEELIALVRVGGPEAYTAYLRTLTSAEIDVVLQSLDLHSELRFFGGEE